MPRDITVTFADGSQHVYKGAPDDVTPDVVQARAQQEFGKPITALDGGRGAARSGLGGLADAIKEDIAGIPRRAGNLTAGLVRGAGSIGATLVSGAREAGADMLDAVPANMRPQVTTSAKDLPRGRELRADMDASLQDFGADPTSLQFKAGKLGAEVAGTAGAGGMVAGVARGAGAAPTVVNAIRTGGFSGGGNALTRALAGGVNGAATAGLANPEDTGKGFVVGGLLPGAVQVAGKAGSAISDFATSKAEWLMRTALKPTIAQQRNGEAATAVQTLLDYGISPTKAGVNKLMSLIDDLNSQVSTAISGSTATVSKQKVLNALDSVRAKFGNQVSPTSDLNAIQGVADDFAGHPNFQWHGQAEEAARAALAKATSGKVGALQAAGKLQTFAAQQRSLAHGNDIPLSLNQPEMQPYYNTGKFGRVAQSPSSLPVPGQPRFPARYTNNIDRVPEGEAGAAEAMGIFNAKRAEEASAAQALAELQARGPTMTVQQAQSMKQGTYKVLANKYGEAGSAQTEAQKGLARGLKEEVAAAVPGVGPLNTEESRLLATLSVVERRALMDMNKNPVGLTALAHNPMAAISFMADRSAAFKALAARIINRATPAAGAAGQQMLAAPSNPLLRALLANEANP